MRVFTPEPGESDGTGESESHWMACDSLFESKMRQNCIASMKKLLKWGDSGAFVPDVICVTLSIV